MVAFDNTVFCLVLHPDAKPPMNVDRVKDRIEYLLDTLKTSGEKIIIATPALAEFLVFAGADGPAYIAAIRDSAIFRVFPFDERAAIENADVELSARSAGDKRSGAAGAEWQKVKVDRQIISVAKVNGATCLYSDDPHVAKLSTGFSITVQGIADLPLPPAVQEKLELVPLIIPESGGGHPEGEAMAPQGKPPEEKAEELGTGAGKKKDTITGEQPKPEAVQSTDQGAKATISSPMSPPPNGEPKTPDAALPAETPTGQPDTKEKGDSKDKS